MDLPGGSSSIIENGPLVCIGPDEWIREHVGEASAASALVCDGVFSSGANAVRSYLRPGKRKASVLWARLEVLALGCKGDGNNNISRSASVDRCNEKIDEILEHLVAADPSTAILVTFQRGYRAVKSLSKQRAAARDPRSTLGWNVVQEEEWDKAMSISRECEAFWISVW